MRLSFPNLVRPKKSAKAVARKLGLPLSSVQAAIAHICGYENWHDLENNHARGEPFALDQAIDYASYVDRHTALVLKFAESTGVPHGDAQFALANCRLTGDRPVSLSGQIALRLNCWRQTVLRTAAKRSRGAVGVLKSPGRNGEVAILRTFGRPTTVITQQNVSLVGDFEYISPRNPPPLFLPMRFYLPYGHWIERDGAKVLFARDYKPMWRIREGRNAERLEPSLWIGVHEQVHYWEDAATPWRVDPLRKEMEALLAGLGIHCLPVWSDALPFAIFDGQVHDFASALDPLMKSRRKPQSDAA